MSALQYLLCILLQKDSYVFRSWVLTYRYIIKILTITLYEFSIVIIQFERWYVTALIIIADAWWIVNVWRLTVHCIQIHCTRLSIITIHIICLVDISIREPLIKSLSIVYQNGGPSCQSMCSTFRAFVIASMNWADEIGKGAMHPVLLINFQCDTFHRCGMARLWKRSLLYKGWPYVINRGFGSLRK